MTQTIYTSICSITLFTAIALNGAERPTLANLAARKVAANQTEMADAMNTLSPTLLMTSAKEGSGPLTLFVNDVLQKAGSYRIRTTQKLIWHIAFSPDNKTLASSGFKSKSASANLWDLASKNLKHSFASKCVPPKIAFSSDGETFTTAAIYDKVNIWNTNTGHLLHHLNEEGFAYEIDSLAFTGNGPIVYAVTQYGAVIIKAYSGETLRYFVFDETHKSRPVIDPKGTSVATVPRSLGMPGTNLIHMWNIDSGTLRYSIQNVEYPASIAFSSNGELFAIANQQDIPVDVLNNRNQLLETKSHGPIQIRRTLDGALITTLHYHPEDLISTMAFSHDNQTLAVITFSNDRRQLYDVEDPLNIPEEQSASRTAVLLINIANGTILENFLVNTENKECEALAFSYDNKTLAFSTGKILNLRTLDCQKDLQELANEDHDTLRLLYEAALATSKNESYYVDPNDPSYKRLIEVCPFLEALFAHAS